MANEEKPDCATKGWVPMPRQHVGKELEATKAFGFGPSVELVPEGPRLATLAGPPRQMQRQATEPPPAPTGPYGLTAQQVRLCKEYGITPAQFAATRDSALPWSPASSPATAETGGFRRTR
ncbi:MAG: hypothetical protein IPM35_18280 [Myxococcales bacterium]|nr:hypothetical protein [Myxococcales bacterium]